MKLVVCEIFLTLKGISGIYNVYHFDDSNNLKVEMSSKKKRQQKKGALKQKTGPPRYTCIEVSRKYHPKPVCFFINFFGDKKEQLFILLFYLLVNVSRGWRSFGSCSAWEGANYLPCGRRGYLVRELEVRGNYTD